MGFLCKNTYPGSTGDLRKDQLQLGSERDAESGRPLCGRGFVRQQGAVAVPCRAVPCRAWLPTRPGSDQKRCRRGGGARSAAGCTRVVRIGTKRSLGWFKPGCRLQSLQQESLKMLKLKAFCLDYWQFLCLQPLHGFYKR